MNIIVLDGQLTNPGDLSWEPLEQLGRLKVYDATSESEVIERAKDATVLVVNKIKLDKRHFDQLPDLKLVCLLATGYDNINIADAIEAGIAVCNAVGYAVDSVAQHVFALLLTCYNKVFEHHLSIQDGRWFTQQWSYSLSPIQSLSGKTLGIYGFGKIGRKVAELGQAFGMKILAHHKHPERDKMEGVEFLSIEELFQQADVISLHAPLSASNKEIINRQLLELMKPQAVLINTGRGGLIQEDDLKLYLDNHPNNLAALDVLSSEPPPADHPLIGIANCIITPHIAWANVQARSALILTVGLNIKSYIKGDTLNRVC